MTSLLSDDRFRLFTTDRVTGQYQSSIAQRGQYRVFRQRNGRLTILIGLASIGEFNNSRDDIAAKKK
jgi:hypothetical protein